MSEKNIPIARPIIEEIVTFIKCSICSDIFLPSNHNSNASNYRCSKCLSSKTIMKDLLCVINRFET